MGTKTELPTSPAPSPGSRQCPAVLPFTQCVLKSYVEKGKTMISGCETAILRGTRNQAVLLHTCCVHKDLPKWGENEK